MAKITKLLWVLCLGFILRVETKAQLSGTYNIPTNYPSLLAAISDLNIQGVSGPVFIEINSGYTETAPAGGYSLTATGTALHPITFRKTGIGVNPLITAYAGGTATPTSAVQDGVWRLIGSDYVTIEGIDITDPNTTNPSTMEYGFGFFKANASDGCQENTIKDCVINLKVINNAGGSGPSVEGSRGINVVNSLVTSQTTALTPISFAGTNSNNRFYSNTIKNCNIGIALIGYVAPNPFTLADVGNDVGGFNGAQGNNLVNFGGASGATNAAAGIRTLAQYNLNVSYNTFNNNDGTGANHTNVLRGIYIDAAVSANVRVIQNTLTLNGGSNSAQVSVIENVSGSIAASNTVSINNNVLLNCGNALNTTGSFFGIFNNGASPSYLELNGNVFNGVNTKATTGNNYLIYNTGPATNSINVNNNLIANCTNSASTSGTYYSIYNNVVSAAALSIGNNTFSNNVTSASTGAIHLIYNTASIGGVILMNNNLVSNCTYSITSGGSFFGVYNNASPSPVLEISNNTFTSNTTAVANGSVHVVFNRGSGTHTFVSVGMNNNLISNCSFSATSNGPFLGIYNNGVTTNNLSLSNNTITSNFWSSSTSTKYLVYNTGSVSVGLNLNNNLIAGWTTTNNTTGSFNGINNSGPVGSALNMSGNTFSNVSNDATSGATYLMYNAGALSGGVITMTNNAFYSIINSASSSGGFYGIYNSGTTFSDLVITNTTFSNTIVNIATGISNFIYNTGAINTSINSINLNQNLISNCTNSVSSNGVCYGIYNNSASCLTLNINNNSFLNNTTYAATGQNYLLYNRGSATNTFATINLNNNLISNYVNSSTSGTFYGIWNNGVTSTVTSILSNTVTNGNWLNTTGLRQLIANFGVALSQVNISSNVIANCTSTNATTGSLFGIYNYNNTSVSSTSLIINNNTFTNNTSAATSGETHYINSSGLSGNTFTSIEISGNLFSGCTSSISAGGPFYGIYNNTASTDNLNISQNTFTNSVLTSSTGSTFFIYNRGGSSNVFTSATYSANLMAGVTLNNNSSGPFFGIFNSGAAATTASLLSVKDNTFANIVSSTPNGGIYIVYNTCPVSNSISIANNYFSSFTNSLNTTGVFYGIINSGASSTGDLTIKGNRFTDLFSTSSTAARYLIYNNGAITNSVVMADNLVSNCSHSISSGGSYSGMYNNNTTSAVMAAINNNTFTNNFTGFNSGITYLLFNSGAVSNTITSVDISGNVIDNYTTTGTSGTFYGIHNAGFTTSDLSIHTNTLSHITLTTTSTNHLWIYNSGRITNTISIKNNLLNGYTNLSNVAGTFFGVSNVLNYASSNFPNVVAIENNRFLNTDLSSANGSIYFVSNTGISTNTVNTLSIANNLIANANYSISGGGSWNGIYNANITSGYLSLSSNTVTNILATSASSGRNMVYNGGFIVNSANLSNNSVNGFSCTTNAGATYYGVNNSGSSQGDVIIANNTLTNIDLSATSGAAYGFYNSASITNTFQVSGNLISGLNHSASTTGGFIGVYNNNVPVGNLNISANTFTNISLYSSNGSSYLINNRGTASSSVGVGSINNNNMGACNFEASSGAYGAIFNNGASYGSLSISANTLQNSVYTTTTSARYFIYNTGTGSNLNIVNNYISGITSTLNTTGSYFGIINTGGLDNLDISGNVLLNHTLSATTGSVFGVYNTSATNSVIAFNNNVISGFNYVTGGNGSFLGLYNNVAPTLSLSINSNSLTNLTLNTLNAGTYFVYNRGNVGSSINEMSFSNNVIAGINHTATSGPFYGLFNNNTSFVNFNTNGNSISQFNSNTATSPRYMIYNNGNGGATINMNGNSISNYTSALNTTGVFHDILNTGNCGGNLDLNGNILSGHVLSTTTGSTVGVYNSGLITGSVNINNNLISQLTHSCTGGVLYTLYNNGGSCSNLSMAGNTLTAISTNNANGIKYMVYNTSSASSNLRMNANFISNYSAPLNTTGNFAGIYNSGNSSGNFEANNNFVGNFTYSASTGTCNGIYNEGSVVNAASINNNQIAGANYVSNDAGTFYGINNLASGSNSLSVNGNTISNTSVSVPSVAVNLIYNSGSSSIQINAISLNNNSVFNFTNAIGALDFYGIHNTCPASGVLSMDGNIFSSNVSGASTANTYLIYNSAGVTSSLSMSNNSLSAGFTNNSSNYSGNLYSVYNTGGSATTTLTMNGNNFSAYSFSGLTGSGNLYFVCNTNNNARFDAISNTWANLSLNQNGNSYLIYNPSSTSAEVNVNNNSVNGFTRTAASGGFYGYYSNGSSPATCTQVFTGNNFSNIFSSVPGTGSFYGLYNADGTGSTYPKKVITNNSISNINCNGLGFLYGYYFDFLGDDSSVGSSVNNNTLSLVTWGGPLYGIYIGANVSSGFAANLYANTLYSLTTSGTGSELYGAYLSGAGNGLNVYKNKISNLNSTGALGTAEGVRINNAAATTLKNNLIGNIYAPATSALNAVNGINVTGGTGVALYYNTVYLNAASSGSIFGSNALFVSSAVQSDVRNNIFVNNSNPSGSGVVAAYRRTSNSLSTYLGTSNNNVFYAGIPAANRLVYTDGSAFIQTFPSFQSLVSPRESNSVWENTAFLSTVGAATNFLHVDVTIPSLTESGASNISGIIDDFDSDTRQGNVGYVGSGTAPDIGADEYNQALVSCSSANAGSVIIPSSSVKCEGETFYLLSTGYTAAGNITHQWRMSTTAGGPHSNVVGGIGANSTAYTTGTLAPGNYYFVLVTTCTVGSLSGTSNEVTVTVNARPTATASAQSQTICSGENIILSGSSNIATSYLWAGPGSFTSATQNPMVTLANTNASGSYTLLAADANCTSMPAFVSVTVHPTPPVFSLTPSASTICIGNSQAISASLPITNPTLTFGNQTNVNVASGYPAPYSVYYGGQKMQMLVLSGELATAGFTTGTPIQSIQFPVSSLGSNWGSSLNDCKNFVVGMKSTTLSSLSVFETGVSNVVAPSDYTPSIGYNNTHNFSTPFIWDGTSNLIIETVFSNSIIGTSGNAAIQFNSPTGFLSTLVYRADNQDVAAVAAATNSNVNIGFVRPDFKLNGTQIGTYSWLPSNGLSSTSGPSVTASPTATGVYSVTLSNGQCLSASVASVEVILNPTINIVSTSSLVCVGNTATLSANGAHTYTWSTNSTNTNIVVAPFVSTTYTVYGSNIACPSSSATILITSAPALTINLLATPAVLCQSGSSTLSVSGAASYTWTGGSNASSIVVTPATTTNYTVMANNGPGCWVNKMVNVKVNSLPNISISPADATICVGESASFEASGVFSFTWSPGGSNSPILVATPLVSGVYTVAGSDQNNCKNTATVSVVVNECAGISGNVNSGNEMSLFPNPSTGMVKLFTNSAGEKEIRIVNSIGTLIYETVITDDAKTIDLSHVAKGVYFVKVKMRENNGIYKLIIH